MSQILFAASTLPLETDLDLNFTALFNLRDLIQTPSYTPASPAAGVDSSGNFVFGATAPVTTRQGTATQTPRLQAAGTSSPAAAALGMFRFSNTASGTGAYFGKSRGATVGTFTIVQSGDVLGLASFSGADGVQMTEAARITVSVDATPGVDSVPGRIDFATSDGTSTTPATRMSLDKTGNLLLGTTANLGGVAARQAIQAGTNTYGQAIQVNGSSGGAVIFQTASTGGVGSIALTSTATSYNTSSDYRLKDSVSPITTSGAFIDALTPCTWTWKVNGATGAGFIAHELQAVSPSSVTGEKDAVDTEGNPIYQAVEYGSAEVVAMLVAEVKALRARLTAAGIA